ncbi:vomeronasal type-1 receptor 2-like, partial [Cricetulus griseus]|uniref:vomeronasal type-1 receptor 2-like n=1 Tax=Cricetulus griseus TaxID=10029 RepID=UPI00022F71ED
MLPSNTILGVCLITQLCVGVTGNSLLFILYIYTFFFKPHFKKLMDSISMHLTIVNVLMVIFTLISHIMSFFGVPKFLDDAGCRAVLFIFRVTRGMSISTTSILSTFQVITITPSNSRWAWLKPKLSKLTLSSLLCSWLINLLIYGINAILATCYPTICPFLLMKNNKLVWQLTFSFSERRRTCFQS